MTDTSELTRMMREWGVPQRAASIVLDAPQQTQAIEYARQFLNAYLVDEAGIMVIAGGVGVGKTIAAAWLMTQEPPKLAWRRFRHVSQIIEIGTSREDGDKKARHDLRNCQTLVIDDVGSEHMTDAYQSFFDGLINARYESSGITVLTTNMTSEQFLERYGKRIYDRLRGRGIWYEIAHESLRGQPT